MTCACCSTPCTCEELFFDITLRITFALPIGLTCIENFEYDVGLLGYITCEAGVGFEHVADLDVDLCEDGVPGAVFCGSVRIFLSIDGACDCTSTDNCTVVVTGFEEVNCPGGIASVTVL